MAGVVVCPLVTFLVVALADLVAGMAACPLAEGQGVTDQN
jgi:hypothetical protein